MSTICWRVVMEPKEPFKIERFKSVPSRLNLKEPHKADTARKEANQARAALPPKHFIKNNFRQAKQIE